MRCRCGNDIQNVPEHLAGLAEWVCQKCTNTAPKTQTVGFNTDEPIQKQVAEDRKKKAA